MISHWNVPIELGNDNCLSFDSLVIREVKVFMMNLVGCQICYDHVEMIKSLNGAMYSPCSLHFDGCCLYPTAFENNNNSRTS